jgi:hypothetical protein
MTVEKAARSPLAPEDGRTGCPADPENYICAGHMACCYSQSTPPIRSRRRMSGWSSQVR